MTAVIAVIGAGPKAAAIAARAAVLRDLLGSANVPEIHIFEKTHIGSAWSGIAQYTDGFMQLCTPGEKDVGFPYFEAVPQPGKTRAIGVELFRRFSWTSYLVASDAMAEWVERGRPHPSHNTWKKYLEWVFEQAHQNIYDAVVARVSPGRGKWLVDYVDDDGAGTFEADAVVLTGPGRPNSINLASNIPPGRILDTQTFWSAREQLARLTEGNIIVAGGGGGAGAIIAWLAERLCETKVSIQSVTQTGTLFPRGDGYSERRWFSDPSDWPALNIEDRRKIIEHTEAGVISLVNKARIDRSPNVVYQVGFAEAALWNDSEASRELTVHLSYRGRATIPVIADYLVMANGFDPWTLLEVVEHTAINGLLKRSAARDDVEKAMLANLSFPPSSGLPAGLHVPALCTLARGPGYSNLGCLGLLAKSVLQL